MTEKYLSIPPEYYYEEPWILNDLEIEETGSLFLTPDEALTLLIRAVDKRVDPIKRRALETIRDSDEPLDFISLIKQEGDDDDS